jgi:multiple sugar transport system ATP-binding protein
VQQVGDPLELYNHPENLFVAGFIGSPPMNFFRGTLQAAGGHVSFIEDNPAGSPLTITLDKALAVASAQHIDKPVVFGVRPEAIHDSLAVAAPDPARTADVRVEVAEPMGSETLLYLDTGATTFVARVSPTDRFEAGQKVSVTFDLAHAHLFDSVTEKALR